MSTNAEAGARPEPRHRHLLFLPPYSSGLNPIEMMSAKLKYETDIL